MLLVVLLQVEVTWSNNRSRSRSNSSSNSSSISSISSISSSSSSSSSNSSSSSSRSRSRSRSSSPVDSCGLLLYQSVSEICCLGYCVPILLIACLTYCLIPMSKSFHWLPIILGSRGGGTGSKEECENPRSIIEWVHNKILLSNLSNYPQPGKSAPCKPLQR